MGASESKSKKNPKKSGQVFFAELESKLRSGSLTEAQVKSRIKRRAQDWPSEWLQIQAYLEKKGEKDLSKRFPNLCAIFLQECDENACTLATTIAEFYESQNCSDVKDSSDLAGSRSDGSDADSKLRTNQSDCSYASNDSLVQQKSLQKASEQRQTRLSAEASAAKQRAKNYLTVYADQVEEAKYMIAAVSKTQTEAALAKKTADQLALKAKKATDAAESVARQTQRAIEKNCKTSAATIASIQKRADAHRAIIKKTEDDIAKLRVDTQSSNCDQPIKIVALESTHKGMNATPIVAEIKEINRTLVVPVAPPTISEINRTPIVPGSLPSVQYKISQDPDSCLTALFKSGKIVPESAENVRLNLFSAQKLALVHDLITQSPWSDAENDEKAKNAALAAIEQIYAQRSAVTEADLNVFIKSVAPAIYANCTPDQTFAFKPFGAENTVEWVCNAKNTYRGPKFDVRAYDAHLYFAYASLPRLFRMHIEKQKQNTANVTRVKNELKSVCQDEQWEQCLLKILLELFRPNRSDPMKNKEESVVADLHRRLYTEFFSVLQQKTRRVSRLAVTFAMEHPQKFLELLLRGKTQFLEFFVRLVDSISRIYEFAATIPNNEQFDNQRSQILAEIEKTLCKHALPFEKTLLNDAFASGAAILSAKSPDYSQLFTNTFIYAQTLRLNLWWISMQNLDVMRIPFRCLEQKIKLIVQRIIVEKNTPAWYVDLGREILLSALRDFKEILVCANQTPTDPTAGQDLNASRLAANAFVPKSDPPAEKEQTKEKPERDLNANLFGANASAEKEQAPVVDSNANLFGANASAKKEPEPEIDSSANLFGANASAEKEQMQKEPDIDSKGSRLAANASALAAIGAGVALMTTAANETPSANASTIGTGLPSTASEVAGNVGTFLPVPVDRVNIADIEREDSVAVAAGQNLGPVESEEQATSEKVDTEQKGEKDAKQAPQTEDNSLEITDRVYQNYMRLSENERTNDYRRMRFLQYYLDNIAQRPSFAKELAELRSKHENTGLSKALIYSKEFKDISRLYAIEEAFDYLKDEKPSAKDFDEEDETESAAKIDKVYQSALENYIKTVGGAQLTTEDAIIDGGTADNSATMNLKEAKKYMTPLAAKVEKIEKRIPDDNMRLIIDNELDNSFRDDKFLPGRCNRVENASKDVCEKESCLYVQNAIGGSCYDYGEMFDVENFRRIRLLGTLVQRGGASKEQIEEFMNLSEFDFKLYLFAVKVRYDRARRAERFVRLQSSVSGTQNETIEKYKQDLSKWRKTLMSSKVGQLLLNAFSVEIAKFDLKNGCGVISGPTKDVCLEQGCDYATGTLSNSCFDPELTTYTRGLLANGAYYDRDVESVPTIDRNKSQNSTGNSQQQIFAGYLRWLAVNSVPEPLIAKNVEIYDALVLRKLYEDQEKDDDLSSGEFRVLNLADLSDENDWNNAKFDILSTNDYKVPVSWLELIKLIKKRSQSKEVADYYVNLFEAYLSSFEKAAWQKYLLAGVTSIAGGAAAVIGSTAKRAVATVSTNAVPVIGSAITAAASTGASAASEAASAVAGAVGSTVAETGAQAAGLLASNAAAVSSAASEAASTVASAVGSTVAERGAQFASLLASNAAVGTSATIEALGGSAGLADALYGFGPALFGIAATALGAVAAAKLYEKYMRRNDNSFVVDDKKEIKVSANDRLAAAASLSVQKNAAKNNSKSVQILSPDVPTAKQDKIAAATSLSLQKDAVTQKTQNLAEDAIWVNIAEKFKALKQSIKDHKIAVEDVGSVIAPAEAELSQLKTLTVSLPMILEMKEEVISDAALTLENLKNYKTLPLPEDDKNVLPPIQVDDAEQKSETAQNMPAMVTKNSIEADNNRSEEVSTKKEPAEVDNSSSGSAEQKSEIVQGAAIEESTRAEDDSRDYAAKEAEEIQEPVATVTKESTAAPAVIEKANINTNKRLRWTHNMPLPTFYKILTGEFDSFIRCCDENGVVGRGAQFRFGIDSQYGDVIFVMKDSNWWQKLKGFDMQQKEITSSPIIGNFWFGNFEAWEKKPDEISKLMEKENANYAARPQDARGDGTECENVETSNTFSWCNLQMHLAENVDFEHVEIVLLPRYIVKDAKAQQFWRKQNLNVEILLNFAKNNLPTFPKLNGKVVLYGPEKAESFYSYFRDADCQTYGFFAGLSCEVDGRGEIQSRLDLKSQDSSTRRRDRPNGNSSTISISPEAFADAERIYTGETDTFNTVKKNSSEYLRQTTLLAEKNLPEIEQKIFALEKLRDSGEYTGEELEIIDLNLTRLIKRKVFLSTLESDGLLEDYKTYQTQKKAGTTLPLALYEEYMKKLETKPDSTGKSIFNGVLKLDIYFATGVKYETKKNEEKPSETQEEKPSEPLEEKKPSDSREKLLAAELLDLVEFRENLQAEGLYNLYNAYWLEKPKNSTQFDKYWQTLYEKPEGAGRNKFLEILKIDQIKIDTEESASVSKAEKADFIKELELGSEDDSLTDSSAESSASESSAEKSASEFRKERRARARAKKRAMKKN